MKKETLSTAIHLAEAFVKKAKPVRAMYEEDKMFEHSASKHRAAVRRASLDLTRALADLRQGR